ncbi:cytochrome b561 [Streptomyces minutiscleroticus]|uniref:Cytochrome b561 n=1 Tax=Streptomyces minutiscleroticus TaxID=68238 RepID=A0A918NEC8_9ACTN|nr:COX15/CtaA family protein [Streptomyces minutiscleroticus]GGX60952.1 cytochrome b561 [Streptomyces minutiscleroticus]
MRTPLSWLAGRYTWGPRSLRMAALASVAAAVAIIVTGGVVRVTGSGLGCPQWPSCTGGRLAPTAEMGVHGVIEFGNRLLTGALCLVVGWLVIAARLQREPSRAVLRGAWAQFWVIVLNAVVGGVTVWMRLSPYIVAAHFLAATLLLTAAAVTWDRVQRLEHDASVPAVLPQRAVALGRWLPAGTALPLVVGTAATGSGPHAGDSSDVNRMPFDWTDVTVAHGLIAAGCLVLGVRLFAGLPEGSPARRRTGAFLTVFPAQGLVGVFQSLTSLPAAAVVLHLFGAALVWAGAVRVALAVPSRPATGPAAQPAGGRSFAQLTRSTTDTSPR